MKSEMVKKFDTFVDGESWAQSDDMAAEATALGVELACAVLSISFDIFVLIPLALQKAAFEYVYHFGNWQGKDLPIPEHNRYQMYELNYEGDDPQHWFENDGHKL